MYKKSQTISIDSNREDVELVKRFVNGCDLSFNKLMIKYRERLLWYIAKTNYGSLEHSEDILHDSLIKIVEMLRNGIKLEKVFPWMLVVCRNISMRASSDKIRVASEPNSNFKDKHGNIIDYLDFEEQDVFNEIENSKTGIDSIEQRTILRKLLKKLKPHHQQILKEHLLSVPPLVISKNLKISYRTVKGVLHYSGIRMRRLYKKELTLV